MSKIVWIELLKSNGVVTDEYMKAIGNAYSELGFEVNYVYDSLDCGNRADDVYVVAIAPSVVKLDAKRAKHIVFWAQGIWPEESYMRNGNKLLYWACGYFEKRALKKAERIFAVSNAQIRHYEKKYDIILKDKAYVMPCSNEAFHRESFFTKGKYENPVFVYAGSLAKYQCIETMLDAFYLIQQVEPNASLLFYTGQQEEARTLVEQRDLCNVTIGYADPDELNTVLAEAKYGFVIRDDCVVNRVATPTKISSYISNGVIPVYSESLESFHETAKHIVRLPYQKSSLTKDFLSLEAKSIDPEEILQQYYDYFSKELDYTNKISEICMFLRG